MTAYPFVLFMISIPARIGAYETVKDQYSEMTGAQGGMQMLAVRIAAGTLPSTGEVYQQILVHKK